MATTTTFAYTGAVQTFTVPSGVSSITVECWGGQGDGGGGGKGGYAKGTLAVTSGETLNIYTGGSGDLGHAWNGGGVQTDCESGGDASDVRQGGTALVNRKIVAGGGGGGGKNNTGGTRAGGVGGGTSGGNGTDGSYADTHGRGGTQTSGGAAGYNGPNWTNANTAGTLGQGGKGTRGFQHGGCGGGGYYGGGGGGGADSASFMSAGGGGGSSYTGGVTSATTTAGTRSGDGLVTLTYNRAPSAPGAFTTPTSAEVVNTTDGVAVGSSTDADSDALQYQWDLSLDNGATYANKRATQAGISWTYDYTNEPATTAAKWRVRAWDGLTWSGYTYSPLFTIQHNRTPTAPTPTSPPNNSTQDRATAIRLAATFNDPDTGDSVSQSEWKYRLGTGAWTTVLQKNGLRYYDIPAGLAAGTYEWQMRYWDASGAVSPLSVSQFFTSANAPAGPSITSPLTGSTVPENTVVQWTAVAQDAFQVRRVADNAGAADTAVIYYDSGAVESTTARNHPLSFTVNNRYEHVQMRVREGSASTGLWSAWDSERVLASYTIPAVPNAFLSPGVADITLTYAQPVPATGQPTVTAVDVYMNGTRLAKDLPPSGEWVYELPASGVAYTARVVAYGDNGTTSTTAEIS